MRSWIQMAEISFLRRVDGLILSNRVRSSVIQDYFIDNRDIFTKTYLVVMCCSKQFNYYLMDQDVNACI